MIITLHDPVVSSVDGVPELRIEVTFAPGTLPPGTVAFRVDPQHAAVPDCSVLPLVPAAVVLASRLGQDLRVDEPLPPAVHAGARRVAARLREWYGWRPAELIAPLGAEPVRPRWAHRRRGRGVFFTRGIDSWGTLLSRLEGPRGQRPTHLITVDNEVHVPQVIRDASIDQTRSVADQLGLPLIIVRTDVRALIDPHTDWGSDTHGSVLAGIGMLLRRTVGEVIISPTQWTPIQRPWGSHPDLEPTWSLPDLRVVHESGDEPRWRRVERVMAHPLAAQTIQVCWQGTSDRNCGRCEKCLRLMTSLVALGWMERTAGRFDAAIDPAAIGPDIAVSSVPWCDTIDHLDHVGLAADPLRQRWEQVEVQMRPPVVTRTRPRQPRIPIVDDRGRVVAADADPLLRYLATLGIRRDHLVGPGAALGPHLQVEQPAGAARAAVRILLVPDDPGPARAVEALGLDDLRPLLGALGLDPHEAVPFDPDGQGPPAAAAPPASWIPEPSEGLGTSNRR